MDQETLGPLIFKTKRQGFQILMFSVDFPDDQKSADKPFREALLLLQSDLGLNCNGFHENSYSDSSL
jgi:hypothetical protein